MRIVAEKLIMLRKRAGLTAEALAEKAKIGRATITRIENGHTANHSTNTIRKLAAALHCRPEDLGTPPEGEDKGQLFLGRQAISVPMSAASQNALSLIALRYGEKAETILELAPLLFDIIARESLIERRRNLAELCAHRDAIEAMSSRYPHLSRRFTNDWAADEFHHREEQSIRRDDLRGDFVHADDSLDDSFYPDEFDDECDNPFVAHLRDRCQRIAEEGYEAANVEAVSRWSGPVYEIGHAEAKMLVGGDENLAHGIASGAVPIAAIPKDLLKDDRMADRQTWIRNRLAESAARVSELLGGLGIADLLGEESQ